MKRIVWILVVAASYILSGCAGIDPKLMGKYLDVQQADDNKKTPVVLLFQGSAATSDRPYAWASWFLRHGVSAVLIRSASVRNRRDLYGIHYGSDLAPALIALENYPNLDLERYAVMGFSRGGTAALESAASLSKEQPKPSFVFSLYPGSNGSCPNRHAESTEIHVFYGDLDDWGTYRGHRDACKAMTSWSSNATFHLFKNVHHGYDGNGSVRWICCGGRTFTNAPDEEARDRTRKIILDAIRERWEIAR